MKYSDKEIIEKIQFGDKNEVLKFIYSFYYPKVVRKLKSKGASIEDIKDTFQDTVLVLVKRILEKNYNNDFNIGGFLIGVSVKIWIDKLRKDKKLTFKDEGLDLQHTDFDMSLIRDSEKSALLDQIFESIGERCSKLIKLVYFQGYNMVEVATMMSFSGKDSAKAQHYKCKQKLLKKYKDKPFIKTILIGN